MDDPRVLKRVFYPRTSLQPFRCKEQVENNKITFFPIRCYPNKDNSLKYLIEGAPCLRDRQFHRMDLDVATGIPIMPRSKASSHIT